MRAISVLVQVRQSKSAILYSRLTSCPSEQEEIVKLHHAVSVKLVSVKFASPAKSLEKGSKCHLFNLLHFKVFDDSTKGWPMSVRIARTMNVS